MNNIMNSFLNEHRTISKDHEDPMKYWESMLFNILKEREVVYDRKKKLEEERSKYYSFEFILNDKIEWIKNEIKALHSK